MRNLAIGNAHRFSANGGNSTELCERENIIRVL